MTRETKIGLIVAGSFLCLVCVVVASKWRRGDDKEPEEQTIQVAAVKAAPKANAPEAKKNDGAPKKEAEAKSPEVPSLPTPLPTVSIPGSVPALPQFPEARPSSAPELPKLPEGKPPLLPSLPMDPAPKVDSGPTFPPLLPLAQVEGKKPEIPEAAKPALEIPPTITLPPSVGGTPGELKPAPKLEMPPATLPFTDKDQPPSIPSLTPKEAPKDGAFVFPALPAPKDPAPKDGALVFPPLAAPKDGAPMLPPLGTPTPLPKNEIPSAPNFVFPKDPPTAPSLVDTTPKLIPRIPASDLPSVPTVGVGGNKPLPTVRDVSTDPYVCVPGDTSFAVLSKRFYGTEKYADALLAYNQEHAKWIRNGQALLTNPPTLQPGQNVEQPPVSILERSYKAWIRETAGSTVPTIPSATPAIKPPVTLGTPPGVATVSVAPTLGKGGTYKVQHPNGESVFDVAERTLGNRSLWPEIWRVNQTNPAVRPPAPIPFGTELKLP